MDNITFITWPRGRRSLLGQLLRVCLGKAFVDARARGQALAGQALAGEAEAAADQAAANQTGAGLVAVKPIEVQLPGLKYLVEYEDFPLAAVLGFEDAVARGGEDSAAAFRLFASHNFARHAAFTALWVESEFARAQLVVEAAELRANSQTWLLWALGALVPGFEVTQAMLAKAGRLAAGWDAENPTPDVTAFRYYDPTLFAQLAHLKLRRDVVQQVFREVMERDPEEAAILHFQDAESPDALRLTLMSTREYRRRATTTLPAMGSHAGVTSEILLSPEFQQWERAHKNSLPWPLTQVFVSRRAGLIYCPIGKVACTFLKRQMVQVSDVAHPDILLSDVHGLTDHVRTGLQLGDYPEHQARALMSDPAYIRFAVVRAPQERLLSAYIEKFVIARNRLNNRFHTDPVIRAVQMRKGAADGEGGYEAGQDAEAAAEAAADLGISFRDFITEITAQPSHLLDPHWRPQADYLEGIRYDRIFRLDQMDQVIDMLEQRSGRSLSRQPANVTGSGSGIVHPGAADLLPAGIIALPRLDKASFLDPGIVAMIDAYFHADTILFETSQGEVQP